LVSLAAGAEFGDGAAARSVIVSWRFLVLERLAEMEGGNEKAHDVGGRSCNLSAAS
jgi:hypothetical protein